MLNVNNFNAAIFFNKFGQGRRNKKVKCKYTLGNKHLYFSFTFFVLCNDEDVSFYIVNTSYCQR